MAAAAGIRHATVLAEKIENRSAVVGIVGLGYVGLPLSLAFAENDFRVLGFDIDEDKIEKLARGESYILHLEEQRISSAMKADRLAATSDFTRLAEADAVLICVPTPLTANREPDMRFVEATAEQVRASLRPGQLVVLESTTYPGTTDEVVRPALESTGLVCGRDFFLAFSPEREDPGNPSFSTTTIPKVVGGVDEISGDLAEALYGQVVAGTVRVSSARAAEATKLMENIFRSVNIALVNELKVIYDRMGIDIWEVLDAAATKPFGYMRFDPGPGWGGHCQDGDEVVFVRRRDGLEAVRMKDLATGRGRNLGDVEVIPLSETEVLSFDLDRQQTCFRAATHLFRRWNDRRVTLRTPEGRTLTTTDGHPVIVSQDGGLEVRRADGLGAARPIVALGLPPRKTPRSIDLIEALDLGEIALAGVPEVKDSGPGWVYSLEVPGTETYVTSYGLVSHNCIPIDPYYLSWKAREYGKSTRFIELAGEINTDMPEFVVARVIDALNARGKAVRGSRILVVGLAYKPNVSDDRESPSYRLMDLLRNRGADVAYHDPHVPVIPPSRAHGHWAGTLSVAWDRETVAGYDAVVIANRHDAVDYRQLALWARCIVDTRNAMSGIEVPAGVLWKA